MKAYKGFNKDMTCRGFQYEEGKTYHEDEAELCESGFHACENPLDCFRYYDPTDSVYHEVELEDVTDEKSDDSKRCGKTIKIGAKLDVAGIVKAQIEFVKSKATKEKKSSGKYSAASTQGNWSAASTQGNWSVAVSTGTASNNLVNGASSLSIGWGKDNKCKGALGTYIVLVERGEWDGKCYPQIGEPKLGKIDGKILKVDTWYKLENGEFVECEDGEKE